MQTTLRQRVGKFAERTLPDDLMLVLAALLVPITLLPLAWTLSPFTSALFLHLNNLIIAVFILEYFLKLLAAESRWAFARDPWRMLDLLIIALAVVDYLPFAVSGNRASPLLRLLRVARFAAIAGRSARRAGLIQGAVAGPMEVHPLEMRLLEGDRDIRTAEPDEVRRHVKSPTDTWVDLQHVGERDLGFVSELTGLPEQTLRGKVIEELFPRIETFRQQTTIFLWDSRLADPTAEDAIRIEKTNLLVVCSGPNVLTLSTGNSDLFERIVRAGLPMPDEPFSARVLYALLRAVMSDCETIVRALERRTASFEDAPVGAVGDAFLGETFHLKNEIQKARYNLWHIRQVLDSIRTRRPAATLGSEVLAGEFEHMQAEAQYLYETMENVRDGLMSLIELHLNTVSFEMNRVMRVLAVITCVSVIPTVIGGFLGQNLTDQPFGITLREVTFLAAVLMLLTTYAFWRKGWLRG
jgi:Mg2+ and Co2+ transporter CorA